jgi:hypothetical protein
MKEAVQISLEQKAIRDVVHAALGVPADVGGISMARSHSRHEARQIDRARSDSGGEWIFCAWSAIRRTAAVLLTSCFPSASESDPYASRSITMTAIKSESRSTVRSHSRCSVRASWAWIRSRSCTTGFGRNHGSPWSNDSNPIKSSSSAAPRTILRAPAGRALL